MTIAPLRCRPSPFRRSPVLTRSWLAMAQRTIEPLLTLVTEGVSTSAPPVISLTSTVPVPPPQVQPPLLYPMGQWQPLDSVTKSILVTATRALEAPPSPLSQGHVLFGTLAATVTPAKGSHPLGQSVSPPLRSGPMLVLHFSIPTDGAPEAQYQCLMELAQIFQSKALSARPSSAPSAPEVPLDPAPTL